MLDEAILCKHGLAYFVGEARVNNRKAKLIFFYEWELALKWKGHVNGKEKEITGKIEIPNLSEEHNDMKDVDVDITISNGKGSPEGEILKDMMDLMIAWTNLIQRKNAFQYSMASIHI